MKHPADLIDQFADLVTTDQPKRLAERTLEVVMALSNGRSGAVFSRRNERMTLFASRGIDQPVIDAVEAIWARHREALRPGAVLYVPDRDADPRFRPGAVSDGGPASFAAVPVFEGDALLALLYVDSTTAGFCREEDLERLQKFSRIVAKAVSQPSVPTPEDNWSTLLENTPLRDFEREKLLRALQQNEWNIARVARLLGVSRRTIYLRLQRLDIPRERVRKGALRPAKA